MANPISVLVTRGSEVESVHRVHAVVADAGGRALETAGDAGLVTFMRSAAKPLQALAVARAYPELVDERLAIACASHRAEPPQLRAAERLLALAAASEDDLECGAAGEPPRRLAHNCSGKHGGMLALCAAHGWPTPGYRLPAHPAQRTMAAIVAEASEVPRESTPTATDGCGVVNFALPLLAMARSFARLATLPAGDRVALAMRSHPTLIRGTGAPDTVIMERLPGWIAKGGAEGVLCAASPDGLGVALKVADGAFRAVAPAAAAVLARLGADLPELATAPVRNSRGEVVGSIAAKGA